ncbi:anaphase-promoting complex/cyclosome 2 isoform X2 [Wolffia australiana]
MEEGVGALDALTENNIEEIRRSWSTFATGTEYILSGNLSVAQDSDGYASSVRNLSRYGLSRLAGDHFFQVLEESFRKNAVSKFWNNFNPSSDVQAASAECCVETRTKMLEKTLVTSVEEMRAAKDYYGRCLSILLNILHSDDIKSELRTGTPILLCKYHLMVSSVLLSTLPRPFLGTLQLFFKERLEELSNMISGGGGHEYDVLDQSLGLENNERLQNTGKLVRGLKTLGLASVTEDAYAAAIFSLLKANVEDLAGDEYRNPVLGSIKEWIQAVPLRFLNALLGFLGDSNVNEPSNSGLTSPLAIHTPSQELVRWQLRLEYFAYETLQDLRIAKLFDIIVDFPDSSPAIEDLKQCLDYTGQHSKLVESFVSSLRFRLLTAGASTNDILHQYVSTIKALRIVDPSGVFLEAIVEPIREYLRRRKDTVKCIVTMLTEGSGGAVGSGNPGESLLEELNKDAENPMAGDYDDDADDLAIADDRQAWANAMRWEPDPVEAETASGGKVSRRKTDILGMMVSVVGSKEQLVNEHRVMLAEKLLNKSDYDIDSDIRTLELLKVLFPSALLKRKNSKRTNSNIKLTAAKAPLKGKRQGQGDLSLDVFDATIISSNFWPPIQVESVNFPAAMDELLSEYATRYHEIKAPRKLLWRKNLGTVKLELQFEDRALQFTVSPIHATIIMKFQEQSSWESKNIAAAVGLPEDIFRRRISFWVSKGVVVESSAGEDCVYTVVEETKTRGLSRGGSSQLERDYDLSSAANEEGDDVSLSSAEEQLRREMAVYEKFIMGMLTNVGSMALDRIHNTLKMFCIAEPTYDKSMQQLQSFLQGLVGEEKIEIRDGLYLLKR